MYLREQQPPTSKRQARAHTKRNCNCRCKSTPQQKPTVPHEARKGDPHLCRFPSAGASSVTDQTMDKILAFSILSSSPADISAAGLSSSSSARLTWRASPAGRPRPQADAAPTPRQEKAADQRAPAAERRREARPRFAPEFDGLHCFESIVSA